MKKNKNRSRGLWFGASIALACMIALCGFNTGAMLSAPVAFAEPVPVSIPAADPSPAIYVAQKNANSVVGVITYTQNWNRSSGEVEETMVGQGSGVVIADGGYVLTNYHVVEGGDSYKVLLANGEKVEATMAGSDSAVDLAVLKVVENANQLVPVTVGSSSSLIVGNTVIAIGNPGGEVLANTVTQGIVSALERNTVYSDNTTRNVDYIQHDAAINNGNSGGGLFNYRGELVGINTLKYGGSAYSSVSVDGLGFAIPIDTAYPIAMQLIENGEVIRPQMGISVLDQEGPDEPMGNYPPASVMIYAVNAGSPAERAGLKQFDFIYAVNGERVTSFRELTAILDHFQAGDTVELTVVRYNNAYEAPVQQNNNYGYGYNPFNDFFGNFGYGYNYGNGGNYGYNNGNSGNASSGSGQVVVGGGYDYVTVDVTLEMPEAEEGPVQR